MAGAAQLRESIDGVVVLLVGEPLDAAADLAITFAICPPVREKLRSRRSSR